MNYFWWKCPNCKESVNFSEQLNSIFDDEDGESVFDPKSGMLLHTIECKCGAYWCMSISKMCKEPEIDEAELSEEQYYAKKYSDYI